MAQIHYKAPFKQALLQFITEPDPFLAMLQWVMIEMMRIEALYQKVRVEGRVISVALIIACGVDQAGNREIFAVEPMFDESEDSLFFRKLKSRGMKRIVVPRDALVNQRAY